jgi:hypothetical protein
VKRIWLGFPLAVMTVAPLAQALTVAPVGTGLQVAPAPIATATATATSSATISEWQSQLVTGQPTVPFRIPLDMAVQAPLQPGQLVQAAYTPFTQPMSVMKNNAFGLLSNILAGAQTNFALGYQTIPVANTTPQHPSWESDGDAVYSCDEYVYKRYYDYKRFQEAAATCGGNPDCVYNLWVSTGEGGENRTMLARSAQQGAIAPTPGSLLDPSAGGPTCQIKNPMRNPSAISAFEQALLMAYSAGSPATSEQQAQFQQVQDYLYSSTFTSNPDCYPISGTRAAWHMQMHDQQATYGETMSHRAVIQQRIANVMSLLDAYNDAVFYYNQAVEAQDQRIVQACGGLVAPIPGQHPCTPQTPEFCKPPPPPSQACINARNSFPTAELDADEDAAVALSSALYAEYTNVDPITGVVDNGCLGINHNKCDWSPTMIGAEYLTAIDGAVSGDLANCDSVLGTDPPSPTLDGALKDVQGTSAPQAMDDEVDTYEGLADEAILVGDMRHKLAWLQTAPDTIHYDLFSSGPESWQIGGQFASAQYSQNAFWEVKGETNSGGKLCRLSGRVFGSANASATLLGGQLTVLDADLQIGAGELVADGGPSPADFNGFEFESHLTIGPYSIYSFPDTQVQSPTLNQTLAQEHWDQNIFTVDGQIYFVDLELSVDATADLSVSLTGTAPSIACQNVTDATENTFSIGANVTPTVSAQMVGTALVGALGTGVGVQGTIDLVSASLPINVNAGIGPDPSGADDLALVLNANASLDVTVLSGEFDAVECVLGDCAKQELFRWNGIPAYSAPNLWSLNDSFPLVVVQAAMQPGVD